MRTFGHGPECGSSKQFLGGSGCHTYAHNAQRDEHKVVGETKAIYNPDQYPEHPTLGKYTDRCSHIEKVPGIRGRFQAGDLRLHLSISPI